MVDLLHRLIKTEIIGNNQLTETVFLLRIVVPPYFFHSFAPGKFSMIRVSNTLDPLLNRPFSISFVDKEKDYVSILYRVVGKGTKILSTRKVGDYLYMTPPLGQGFPLKNLQPSSLILLGGGIGIAPLTSIYSENELSKEITLLWGIKEKSEYFDIGKIHKSINSSSLLIASEDGSFGMRGTALDLFKSRMNKIKNSDTTIFACGPVKMLHTLHEVCERYDLPLYVSLETRMACGTGFCLGCALPSSEGGYLRTCQDGPVFNAMALSWEDIHDVT